jgi:hypothetical protein
MKRTLFSVVLLAVGLGYGGFGVWDGRSEPAPEQRKARDEALARAKVFRNKPFNPSAIDFTVDPNRGIVDPDLTTCRFKPDAISGTSPKFDCELKNGKKIKVKYGWTKEINSEVATSRLLEAIGFATDSVSFVRTVRCHGCPFQPFHNRSLAQMIGIDGYLDKRINYEKFRDFKNVSAERKLDGEDVKAGTDEGWAFYELDKIDPARGGATRAEVDALRLMAVFLHHWDNKSQNQRLICADSESTDCEHPLAMIQDGGSSFGPKKVDVEKWTATPVWADHASCTLSMKKMPYGGSTFKDVQITEAGRRLLGDRLKQLTPAQIEALFKAAALDEIPRWVSAFQDRVRQISDRKSCPTQS